MASYHLLDLIHAHLIATGLRAGSDEEAIRQVNDLLVRAAYAEERFAEDVCAREKSYTTGLPTRPVAVAMPHADPDGVLRSAIAIGVLESPVSFGQMSTNGSVKVAAQVVFLLAIKEREKQIQMIRELIQLLQSAEFLEGVVNAGSPDEVLKLIRQNLGENELKDSSADL